MAEEINDLKNWLKNWQIQLLNKTLLKVLMSA